MTENVDELKQQAAESATERQRRQVIQRLNDTDGVSQNDIAEAFGITQSRVSQIANGK